MGSPDAEHRSRSPLPRLMVSHSDHSPVQPHIGGEDKHRSWESTAPRSTPRHHSTPSTDHSLSDIEPTSPVPDSVLSQSVQSQETALPPNLKLPDPFDQRRFSTSSPLDKSEHPHSSLVFQHHPSPNSYHPNPLHPLHMPHRVDSIPMPSSHRREYDYEYDHSYRRPTPPPIATLSHSPSLSISSLDRSSVSSPAPRRSPTGRSVDSAYSDAHYPQDQMHRQSRPYPHDPVRDSGRVSHSYSYTPRAHPEHRYSNDSHPYHVSSSYASPPIAHSTQSSGRDNPQHVYPLPGQNYPPICYTDDAATKLSDRVRRRCFNCCTTDTSTWRRSNLSPGKVLCNKCGLFERTHGRSRPDQFPHRRGSLATSTMRPRTPPQSTHLPPISTHVPPLAPYHFAHPSIAPLQSVPDSRRSQHPNTLPEIQSWIDTPAARTSYSTPSSDRAHDSSRQRSPPRLHHVDMRSSSIHEAVA